MNLFDKFCAAFSFLLGILLILLGVVGVFEGCHANFSLPPVLGVAPAFIGWGIVRPILIAWKRSADLPLLPARLSAPVGSPIPTRPVQDAPGFPLGQSRSEEPLQPR